MTKCKINGFGHAARSNCLKVLWITNRPIAAGERKFNLKAKSGSWLEPALIGLKRYSDIQVSVASPAKVAVVETLSEDGTDHYFFPSSRVSCTITQIVFLLTIILI